MIKILTIIGARPQFIKAAAISRAIRNHFSSQIKEVIVHTGQHYDPNMSAVFFNELEIPQEKYNLRIGSGNHANQTASMMVEIDKVISGENPDALLVYGDTNSTLAACLVAIKIHLPVIHVEAGVRSYNKKFPEEVNRLICDHMSSMLFVPSDAGMDSLKKEGFNTELKPHEKLSPDAPMVYRCGDIMYDNTLYFKDKLGDESLFFEKFQLPAKDYILCTMHRPSNVDQHETLESILSAFRTVVENKQVSIILPLHPRTKEIIEKNDKLQGIMDHDKIFVIPAVSFLEMILLEKHASLVITDSGGVQKEAYFMKKPCLIMLEETPWTELVETGNAILVGSDFNKIVNGARYFLENTAILKYPELYGDGKSAEFICKKLITHLN